jgi:dTDP-4-dehydrorhamnose reductase
VNSQGRSLVVGASGQVGAQVVRMLGPGRSIATSNRMVASGIPQLDLGTLNAKHARELVEELAPDAVFCVGGLTDVELSESESDLAMRVNCEGPAHLAAAAAAQKLPFVFFSTEYVFNGLDGPYREDDAADPINAYGRSKWQGELAVLESHPSPLILRTTVVYGPDPGEKNFLYTLRRVLTAGRPMRVADDQISTPTYNRDLAANTIALLRGGVSGVFHVCGPERISRFEFAQRAARLMGLDESAITAVSTGELGQKARRPLNAGLLTDKLRAEKVHLPMRTLKESLRDWMAQ